MDNQYKPGQQVELEILRESELGFLALIDNNNDLQGLLYHNEIFENLQPGQILPGYIKFIRPDGKIDLQLHPFGNFGAEALAEVILNSLKKNEGYIPINSKSPAQDIYDSFGVSKKNFKMALGWLYKKRLVQFTDVGTELVSSKKVD